QPPFAGGATYETIKLLLDTEPKKPRLLNPKIDRDLSTICLKCLEKDPKRRYSSALALAEDLEHWLKHEPIQARHTGVFARGKKWLQRNPTSALLAASLIALVAASGWIVWKSELIGHPVTTGIAVLPFENLGEQKEQTAFADGVQDDILTKLAKIGDLKVISRNSVMEYRGKRNLRQIGNDLRVSHVLEGSIRRAGTVLHMNAQFPEGPSVNLSEAVDLLNKAVARDPNFFQAYCQLAFAHDLIYEGVYQGGIDHTPARLAMAQSAIDSAFRLRPDSGEAHLALAWHLTYSSDYDRARAELALAQQSLPNRSEE